MKRTSIILSVVCLAFILMVDRSAFALEYTFTDLGYIFSGSSSSTATDMNDLGQIVGTYTDATGTHGYVLNGCTFSTFDVPNAVSFTVNGINDRGQIVGDYWDGTNSYGYIKYSNTYTIIQSPGNLQDQYSFYATGINNEGQVVGAYRDDPSGIGMTSVRYGYILDGDTFTSFQDPDMNLNYPNFNKTVPTDINNDGQIVGYYQEGSGGFFSSAFIKDGDTYTDFQNLPGFSDIPPNFEGINDRGQIVGSYRAGDWQSLSVSNGFIGDGTTFYSFSYPDALGTYAHGINNSGCIVGNYYDGTSYHAFTANPVPEPATMLLLGSGFLGLAGFRKKLIK